MKKALFFFGFLILTINFSYSQITWEKLFSKVSTDAFRCIENVPSGGFVAAGYTADSTVNDTDAYVVRLNNQGDTLWTFTYNGPLSKKDLFYKIINTTDGGFITCGYSTSETGLSDDFMYLKLSSSGQMQWVKFLGGPDRERAQDIVETIDGYTIAGYTTSPPAQYYDVLVVHTDFNGDTLWTKILGDPGYDDANAIRVLADGGYILGGQSNSNTTNYDHFIIRMNADGDTLWTKHYGTVGTDNIESLLVLPDGFVFAGSVNSLASGDDGYLFKTDTSGNLLWSKIYGGTLPDDFHRVSPTSDGGFILSGTSSSSGPPEPNMWLVRTNAIGDTLWTRTYGGDNHDHGYSAVQTADGGFVFAGYTSSFGFNNEEGYIVKTDTAGHVIAPFVYVTALELTSPTCSSPTSSVKALIRNYSHDPVLNPSFTMIITGTITQTLTGTYLGILNPLDVDTVLFSPTINTTGGGTLIFNCSSNVVNDVYPPRSSFTRSISNLLPCVGIDEIASQLGILVSPNPATTEVVVDFSENFSEARIEIFNSTGGLIKQEIAKNTGGLKKKINVSTYGNGLYLLKISTENKFSVHRILVN